MHMVFNILKKVLTLVLTLSISSLSFAQTQTSTIGKVTRLNKGDVAPFSGYLLDPLASAEVITYKKYIEKENQAKLTFELDKLTLEKDKEIDKLKGSLQNSEEKYESVVRIKNQQINEIIQNKDIDLTWLWISLSFLAGIGLTTFSIWGISKLRVINE